jgi:hypothetical protein
VISILAALGAIFAAGVALKAKRKPIPPPTVDCALVPGVVRFAASHASPPALHILCNLMEPDGPAIRMLRRTSHV